MNRANASLSQEIRPIFLRIFVINPVFEVVRQQILQLNRCREAYSHEGVYALGELVKDFSHSMDNGVPGHGIILIIRSIHLEIKWR